MIPAAFDYHAPASLPEAIALLSRFSDTAKVISGGQSLLPLLKLRLGLFEQHMSLWASKGRQEGPQAKHIVFVAPSHGHGQVEHGRIAERHQGTDGVEYGESTAQIRVDADVHTDSPASHFIALCRAPLATAVSPSQSRASPGYPGGTHRWENSGRSPCQPPWGWPG